MWEVECACGPSTDLVLWGELLHVGPETPEARQEVVDHHLLRYDCACEVKERENTFFFPDFSPFITAKYDSGCGIFIGSLFH